MAAFGTYNIPAVIKGDHCRGLTINTNFSFTSVALVFNYKGLRAEHTFTPDAGLTVGEQSVSIDRFSTATWADGLYMYAMAFTLANGDVQTYLVGTFEVIKASAATLPDNGDDPLELDVTVVDEEVSIVVSAGLVEQVQGLVADAAQSASTATTKAGEAVASAGAAAGSATNSSNSANAATESAATASTKASEAVASANLATAKAEAAATSESNAVNAATAAAGSAATAAAILASTIKQLGNAFGTAVKIGTTDNNEVHIIVNGNTVANFSPGAGNQLGPMRGTSVGNAASTNNGIIVFNNNGIGVVRNVNDSNAAFTINNQQGTGAILALQQAGALILNIHLNKIIAYTSAQINGILDIQQHLRLLNKSSSGYLNVLERNTSGAEVVADLKKIGDIHFTKTMYIACASETEDTVGDFRMQVNAGIVSFYLQVCTVANVTKGAGTWGTIFRGGGPGGATDLFASNAVNTIISLHGNIRVVNKANSGYIDFLTRDTSGSEVVFDLRNVGKAGIKTVYLHEASATADTVNDKRLRADASGIYAERCSVAGATKGGGTWVSQAIT